MCFTSFTFLCLPGSERQKLHSFTHLAERILTRRSVFWTAPLLPILLHARGYDTPFRTGCQFCPLRAYQREDHGVYQIGEV